MKRSAQNISTMLQKVEVDIIKPKLIFFLEKSGEYLRNFG